MKYILSLIILISFSIVNAQNSANGETTICEKAVVLGLNGTIKKEKIGKSKVEHEVIYVSLDSFLVCNELMLDFSNCEPSLTIAPKITRYKFIIVPKKGPAKLLAGNSNDLTEQAMNQVLDLEPGDKVIIEAIETNVGITLPPIVIVFKK